MSIDLKYQVPTVAVHTEVFESVVKSVVRVNGAPRMRQVYVPHPVMGKTAPELRAYVDGNDPLSGRPVMQEIIEGLIGTLSEDDLKGLTFERSTARLCESATEEELHMNCGIGAMGPYNHANATIGRAFGLLSQNLQGGSVPGQTYMGSQGNGYAYGSMTFAENEERSPWEPLHVQRGFKPTDSVVT